uniref:Uncharacterized protein n=1 Tax=Leersia perrieri TaxID=77586 RepID=A0A0D9WCG2_9ORYZ
MATKGIDAVDGRRRWIRSSPPPQDEPLPSPSRPPPSTIDVGSSRSGAADRIRPPRDRRGRICSSPSAARRRLAPPSRQHQIHALLVPSSSPSAGLRPGFRRSCRRRRCTPTSALAATVRRTMLQREMEAGAASGKGEEASALSSDGGGGWHREPSTPTPTVTTHQQREREGDDMGG